MRERYLTAADGSAVYVSVDGDMVDLIAHVRYGSHLGNTERVYDANPGLAARGPVLPAGVVVKLPEAPAQSSTARPFRRLWD